MCKTCSCAADFLTDPEDVAIDEENGQVLRQGDFMEEKIIFYTIGCPLCKGLEAQLKNKNIKYETVEGTDKLIALGMRSAPILQVGDKLFTYKEALIWLTTRK
jgi:glutaredoxin